MQWNKRGCGMCPKILNQDFLGSVQHTSVFLLISPHCAFFICSYPSAAREKTRQMVSVVGLSNVLLIFFSFSLVAQGKENSYIVIFIAVCGPASSNIRTLCLFTKSQVDLSRSCILPSSGDCFQALRNH